LFLNVPVRIQGDSEAHFPVVLVGEDPPRKRYYLRRREKQHTVFRLALFHEDLKTKLNHLITSMCASICTHALDMSTDFGVGLGNLVQLI